jgi:hypothetical protein
MSEDELLTGDGVTEGIVRIGDTVRRPLASASRVRPSARGHSRI